MTASAFPGNGVVARASTFLVALGGLAVLLESTWSAFDVDEFEHLHSAWYVTQGALPYTDFLQHHHPLLWYCLVPVVWLWGESTSAILAARVLMLPLAVGIAGATAKLAQLTTGNRDNGLISVVLLLSATAFRVSAVEVRPDVPQAMAGVWSLCWLFEHIRDRRPWQAVAAGSGAALALLFLQKALLFLPVLALLLSWAIGTRRVSTRAAAWLAAGFGVPTVLFVGLIAAVGLWPDYVAACWIVPRRFLGSPAQLTPRPLLVQLWHSNPVLWLLVAAGIAAYGVMGRGRPALRALTIAGAAFAGLVLLAGAPFIQYLLPALPLLCVPAGAVVVGLFRRLRPTCSRAVAALALLALPPLWLNPPRRDPSRVRQLAVANYVLKNSTTQDSVYDGNSEFNLFRKDVHYLWYSISARRVARVYGTALGGPRTEYDICALISQKRPKLVSDHLQPLRRCGLEWMYTPTPFSGLYRLREPLVGDTRGSGPHATIPGAPPPGD